MNLLESYAPGVVFENVLTARETAMEDFRANVTKYKDYYHGVQIPYLMEKIKDTYTNYEVMKIPYTTANFTKVIIDKLSMLYKGSPKRDLVDGTEKDNLIFNGIIEQLELNSKMKLVDRYTRLLKTVICKIAWVNDRVGMKFQIYTPEIIDIVQNEDDPTDLDAVIYMTTQSDTDFSQQQNDTLINYVYWDRSVWFVMDENGQEIEWQGEMFHVNPYADENGYGFLPFVVFRDRPATDNFWLDLDDHLVEGNEKINMALTEMFYYLRFQGFSQPVSYGYKGKKKLTFDPASFLNVPLGAGVQGQNPKVEFMIPDQRAEEFINIIETQLKLMGVTNNLSVSSFLDSKSYSSGFAKWLDMIDVIDDRDDRRLLFMPREKEMGKKIISIWNYHMYDTGQQKNIIKSSTETMINYEDVTYPLSQNEIDKHNEYLMKNYVITPVDLVKERDPDLTDKEAIEVIKKNKKIMDQLEEIWGTQPYMVKEKPPNTSEEEEGEEEEEEETPEEEEGENG